jgi:hypothetical protein
VSPAKAATSRRPAEGAEGWHLGQDGDGHHASDARDAAQQAHAALQLQMLEHQVVDGFVQHREPGLELLDLALQGGGHHGGVHAVQAVALGLPRVLELLAAAHHGLKFDQRLGGRLPGAEPFAGLEVSDDEGGIGAVGLDAPALAAPMVFDVAGVEQAHHMSQGVQVPQEPRAIRAGGFQTSEGLGGTVPLEPGLALGKAFGVVGELGAVGLGALDQMRVEGGLAHVDAQKGQVGKTRVIHDGWRGGGLEHWS